MELIQNILIFFLIFSLIAGLVGVFYCNNYIKKIACLAVSYSNLIIMLIIFAKNSQKADDLFSIIPTILILFSIIFAVGIYIISNIARLTHNKQTKALGANE